MTASETGAGDDTEAASVVCPHCGSSDVVLEQRKGSSICRRLYLCRDCREPFEDMQ